jgi:hypothetical protein
MPTKKPSQPKPAEPTSEPRLAASQSALIELGLDLNTWRVLTDSIFPSAKTAEGVLLAVRYCQARGLDVLKRPVHVVPMWSKALGRDIQMIWPGINEVQITAARTGQWAGMDAPDFGPDITRLFQGRDRTESGWEDMSLEVSYPEWAQVRVYRLVGAQRCPFSATVFWEEAYSRAGGSSSEVPTANVGAPTPRAAPEVRQGGEPQSRLSRGGRLHRRRDGGQGHRARGGGNESPIHRR